MQTLIKTASFTIEYLGRTFHVTEESFGPGQTVYIISFASGGTYLALARATGLNDPKFWTTVPQNIQRYDEAQEIGKLIFGHFNPA